MIPAPVVLPPPIPAVAAASPTAAPQVGISNEVMKNMSKVILLKVREFSLKVNILVVD